MEASIEDSTITLLGRNDTSDSVECCLLYIQRPDTTVTGYTDEHGQFTDGLVDKDSITSIQAIKPGYRKYIVHPYGYKRTLSTEILQQDVKFYGDYVVDTTCTLYVPPRARIDGIYGIPEWNANEGYSSITTEITLNDSSYFLIQGQAADSVYLDLCAFNRLKGTLITDRAVVDYYLGIAEGYDNTSAIVRHSYIDGELIGDWSNSTGAHSGSLYVDSCYIDGRIKLHDCSGGAKIYNSTFAGNNYECLKLDDMFSGTSNVNNCVFRDYSFYGVLIEDGSITIEDCDFYSSNTGVPVYNYGTVHFDGCTLDAYGANYCLYTSSNSQASGNETLLKNPSTACVYLADSINFGDKAKFAGNCFVKGRATDFFYAPTKLLVQANSCYFDATVSTATYEPDNLIVEHDDESDVCRVDPSYDKIIIVNNEKALPEIFSLYNAVPNPFNSTVSIEFDIPEDTDVSFEIYNVIGEKIITLIDGELERGRYRAFWDGKNDVGVEVSTGTYLYRLKTDKFDETRKLTLIK
ncbi:MAG: T9SS type A sorting domain-containing protein [bacterium]